MAAAAVCPHHRPFVQGVHPVYVPEAARAGGSTGKGQGAG
jgi:hypothetical protein